jgi:decaprenylphospho-beta-D-ribofuranose 2-oxidase
MKVSGWGNIFKSSSSIWQITSENYLEIKTLSGSLIPRGQGRAYGDASTIQGGTLVSTENLDKILYFNQQTGICRLEGGVTFEKLLIQTINSSWYPPVIPGSRFISMGGALASDVHGKNHFLEGSFSDHVVSFNLLTKSGEVLLVTRHLNEDLFFATAGGMGLTGVILDLEIQLKRSESNQFSTRVQSTTSFQETLLKLSKTCEESEYAIAWIDFANTKEFGRSIVYGSNRDAGFSPSKPHAPKLLTIPKLPLNVMSRILIKVYNSMRFWRMKKISKSQAIKQSIWEVMFPSDLFNSWNRLFGFKGLMEYQFVFSPEKNEEVEVLLREMCELVNPALCAIKILGEGNQCYLSFPRPGYLVGITFPWEKGLESHIDEWDKTLVTIGARKYLSKDVLTKKEVIQNMYPNINSMREVRKKYDPNMNMNSDLSIRLFSDLT